jgi:hypothetical protein
MHWATKAFQHADTYFNIICTIPCEKVKLTPKDDLIYNNFKAEFPDFKLDLINEQVFKSIEAKEKWRNFIAQFENEIEDYNFGTLLRNDCKEPYGPQNSFIVPRIQFLCVEIARNRLGLNKYVYQNKEVMDKREVVDNEELEKDLAILKERIQNQLDNK